VKIDIHLHTKRCKTGDAPTRDISASDFCERILSTDVRIVAITNHNVFDLPQYEAIRATLGNQAQVWPGVELDILQNGSRGHLLVIASPSHSADFSKSVERITKGYTPDNFVASIDEVITEFEPLEPLYVAHYRQKKPNLSDEALQELLSKTGDSSRVILEVTNAISAGIYISHGHASIYGSDIHDWSHYETESRKLPDLRLPVDSFEHFCLLLAKDPTTINTALDRKTAEELVLRPFGEGTELKVKVFNDINVIFGAKGTGKSCILEAIARHYAESGVDARVYVSASDRLEEIFDLDGKRLTLNLAPLDINYCSDEIEVLKDASEVSVTSVSKFAAHYASTITNRNAQRIRLKDIEPEEESAAKSRFEDSYLATTSTKQFLEFLRNDPAVSEELRPEELADLIRILSELSLRLDKKTWTSFSGWKETRMLNSAIALFRREVERKTGNAAKPTSTGFLKYATNRMVIEHAAAAILKSVDTNIPEQSEYIGSLGSGKGELTLQTAFRFHDGSIRNSAYGSLAKVKKRTQAEFVKTVRQIHGAAYTTDLFQLIAKLNAVDEVEDVITVFELLLFKRHFALDGEYYDPSSGESSMVMLQKELEIDRDVYILDEPERSLGNEYISDVIVPLINERARAGKKIFISTHDANIAVRTLPYCSVYRAYGPEGYKTYVGNAISNNLVNADDPADTLNWREVSMRTLEGGRDAFGERGRIYGNT
jgi:predicted ATPase